MNFGAWTTEKGRPLTTARAREQMEQKCLTGDMIVVVVEETGCLGEFVVGASDAEKRQAGTSSIL